MNTLESHLLQALTPWRKAPAWRVAFSGGLDSSVLLYLLAQLGRHEALPPLSAVHIEHGLQAAADAWPAHCARVCTALNIPLRVERVVVDTSISSLEQAARQARYAAFERLLGPAEVLLTAQHRDDQVETLLFRLLRGAGVKGLAGMPVQRVLGRGTLLRPLLEVSRTELEGYAQANHLQWVEDPSNTDNRFARNYLRQQLLPLLEQRWPGVRGTLWRSAVHMHEAQQLLDELAELDLRVARTPAAIHWLLLPSLDLRSLAALGEARQRNALRCFLAPLTQLPDSQHWAGWRALRDAAADAAPVWRLQGGELQRAQGRIWWLSGRWLQPVAGEILWPDPSVPLCLPENGRLHISGQPPAGRLSVRYRSGGEQLRLPGRGHRDLKRLFNEAGLPAFVRQRLPLLYLDDQLVALANLPQCHVLHDAPWQLLWEAPPTGHGLS